MLSQVLLFSIQSRGWVPHKNSNKKKKRKSTCNRFSVRAHNKVLIPHARLMIWKNIYYLWTCAVKYTVPHTLIWLTCINWQKYNYHCFHCNPSKPHPHPCLNNTSGCGFAGRTVAPKKETYRYINLMYKRVKRKAYLNFILTQFWKLRGELFQRTQSPNPQTHNWQGSVFFLPSFHPSFLRSFFKAE